MLFVWLIILCIPICISVVTSYVVTGVFKTMAKNKSYKVDYTSLIKRTLWCSCVTNLLIYIVAGFNGYSINGITALASPWTIYFLIVVTVTIGFINHHNLKVLKDEC